MKKISIKTGIIIILAAAVVLFGGVYTYQKYANPKSETLNLKQIQNSNPETAGWKTYKNDENGYEIKYPNDWDGIGIGSYDGSDCSIPFYEFVKRGGTIDGPDLPYTSITLSSIEKIVTENNLEGYKTTWIYSNKLGDKKYYLTLANFRNEKNCLIVEIGLSSNTYPNENNPVPIIYNKVLSTFKFTK